MFGFNKKETFTKRTLEERTKHSIEKLNFNRQLLKRKYKINIEFGNYSVYIFFDHVYIEEFPANKRLQVYKYIRKALAELKLHSRKIKKRKRDQLLSCATSYLNK